MSMHHISGLNDPTIPFNIISQTEGFSEKVFEQKIRLHIFIENSS